MIDGKGKIGYLTRDTKQPTDANLQKKWKSENSKVMPWLINSIKPSIGKTYLVMPISKDIWEVARDKYFDAVDSSQIFEIKAKLWQTKQREREIVNYYMEMMSLWQELDLSVEEEWDCAGDSVRYKKCLENERVHEILAGLIRELDDFRG